MADLTIDEKAKLFNFGIAVRDLAKKSGLTGIPSKYNDYIDIDEWEGKITIRLMTSECAKRESDKEKEIAAIQEA